MNAAPRPLRFTLRSLREMKMPDYAWRRSGASESHACNAENVHPWPGSRDLGRWESGPANNRVKLTGGLDMREAAGGNSYNSSIHLDAGQACSLHLVR